MPERPLIALLLLFCALPAAHAGAPAVDLELSGTGVDETLTLPERLRAGKAPRLGVSWSWPAPAGAGVPALVPRSLVCDVQLFRGEKRISGVEVVLRIELFHDGERVLKRRRRLETALLGQAFFQLDDELAGLPGVDAAEVRARLRGRKRIDRARLRCEAGSGIDPFPSAPALEALGEPLLRAANRGGAFHALGRPARARDLPTLRNVWGWPASFSAGGPSPTELSCALGVFKDGARVSALPLTWAAALVSGGEVVAEASGRGRVDASGFRFSLPLRDLGVEAVEVADVRFDLGSSKRVDFARFDCLAMAGP